MIIDLLFFCPDLFKGACCKYCVWLKEGNNKYISIHKQSTIFGCFDMNLNLSCPWLEDTIYNRFYPFSDENHPLRFFRRRILTLLWEKRNLPHSEQILHFQECCRHCIYLMLIFFSRYFIGHTCLIKVHTSYIISDKKK